jgi:WD40 repeat protein/serine/threonine protein kinase
MSTPSPAADRNLVFGLLALQMDFVTREQLLDAMHAWMLDKQTPLGDILCRRGVLDARRARALDALVEMHVEQHGNPQASLAALRVEPSVRRDLGQLDDADVQASLAGLAPHPRPDFPATGDGKAEDSFAALPTTAPVADTAFSIRFRRLREHAKGGLGEVFVALDGELDREVALKEIQQKHADHPESRARFLTEARVTGALEHPGIVPVYGLGVYQDGRPYYAMRFIKGDSLKDAIDTFHAPDRNRKGASASERSLELRQLLRRFVDVCNAIAYAHDKGVIHLDLKPANVMLGKFGETLVVDWGLAKVMGQADVEATTASVLVRSGDSAFLTQAGRALGTPAFMSPEQAAGRLDLLSPASDTYSLGATLYCLLTGQTPFIEKDVGVVLARVQKGDFKPPRQVNASVPPALEAVCLKATALKAQDRYCSARELAEEIEHWLADEPVRAYPEPRRVRLARWGRRHKPLVAGAAALLLTAVVALSLGLVLLGQANNQIQGQKRAADEAKQQAEKRGDQLAALNDTLLRANYIADMNLAHHAWAENNLIRTRELLELHRPRRGEPDLRGFEWHYLRRLFDGELHVMEAHAGGVLALAFTSDGKRLFSCGISQPLRSNMETDAPREIKLWDLTTGHQLPLGLKGPTEKVRWLAVSPDGTRLAAACGDQGIRIWDLATGEVTTLEPQSRQSYRVLSFSRDGKQLVSLSTHKGDRFENADRTVRVWDLAARKVIATVEKLPVSWINAPELSPDGKLLAYPDYLKGVVRVFEAATGREAFSCKYRDGWVTHAVFSPDGKRLAACGGRGIQLWDVATRQAVATWPSPSKLGFFLAYSPDGNRLAVGTVEGSVELWDTPTGQKAGTFNGHAGGVYMVAFSPDGTRLASAGHDGTVRLWDTTGRRDTVTISTGEASNVMALSPDGRTVFNLPSGVKAVRFWDATTGEPRGEAIPISQEPYPSSCYGWTADGKRLFFAEPGKQIKVFDALTGKVVRTLSGAADNQGVLAVNPDGKWCAHCAPSGAIKLRDAQTGAELRTMTGLGKEVHYLAFSPDGSRLLGVDKSGAIRIWDRATGRETVTTQLRNVGVIRIRFSPDGKRLAVVGGLVRSLLGAVRILDAESGRELFALKGHTVNVLDAAFSPDGQRLATCSTDSTVRLWDLAAGQEVLTLRGHTRMVTTVRFVSDGRRLISASVDGIVRIWDATPLLR